MRRVRRSSGLRIREPPMAALTRSRFREPHASRSGHAQILLTIRRCAAPSSAKACSARVHRWNRRVSRQLMPNASTMQAMVEAVPMVMQCPWERYVVFRFIVIVEIFFIPSEVVRSSEMVVFPSLYSAPCRRRAASGPPECRSSERPRRRAHEQRGGGLVAPHQ